MCKKKPIFLTDGKGSIYKLEKLIKAAKLKNLETGESVTAETVGSSITGFAIIKMPEIKDDEINQPKTTIVAQKDKKPRKTKRGKSSQYFGVAAASKKAKKPWRTSIWLDGKNISTGSYDSEIEAAKAVDIELVKRGKPKRNFP